MDKQKVELVFNTDKNKFEVDSTVTHLPLNIVELLINEIYEEVDVNKCKSMFDLFIKELKLAKLISKLGWVTAILVMLIAMLKMKGIL